MKKIKYATQGTCSRKILVRLDNGTVKDVKFVGGCAGNLQAVARLARGKGVYEVITLLEGIQCRDGTSCPDQLAKALRTSIKKNDEGGKIAAAKNRGKPVPRRKRRQAAGDGPKT